ncbi:hypothetical protein QK290_13900 [Pseudarthrobacter sp. AL07]|nr:hypothetical protein [Pseudarthrobacter sp. AL20]MDI3196229.1 hypothetical protein [Pseudarthrobacter sp. AL20]MDI3209570.1 hypothetical protein [Pseudarthrobacter sp. AL07]
MASWTTLTGWDADAEGPAWLAAVSGGIASTSRFSADWKEL